jgi:hypothetical protein
MNSMTGINNNRADTEHALCIHYDGGDTDGLMPRIWGPPMWKALHAITFSYPSNPTKDQMFHYEVFFKTLAYVLPCKSCRKSYTDFIESGETKLTKDVFRNKDSLTLWLYKIHEAVNRKLGVTSNVTYEDLVETYESFRAKCDNKDKCLSPQLPLPSINEIRYKKYKFAM